MPPEPKSICSQVLQNKIIQVAERMRDYNYSINDDINKKKNFKNPSIYEKLIEAHGINEFGSSFPNVKYGFLKTILVQQGVRIRSFVRTKQNHYLDRFSFHGTGTASNSSSLLYKLINVKSFILN